MHHSLGHSKAGEILSNPCLKPPGKLLKLDLRYSARLLN